MKLYLKTAILIGGVFLAFTSVAITLLYISENRHIEAEGLARAETLGSAAFEAVYASMRQGGDRQTNRAIVEHLRQLDDLYELRLIHGPPLDRQFGVEPREQPQDDLDRRALAGESVHDVQQYDGVRMVRQVTPVFAEAECQACHQAEVGEVIGVISVQVSLEASDRALAARRNALLGWLTASLLGLGLATYWGVQRLVVRPVERIRTGAAALAAGDLGVRLGMAGDDEIGALARSFNGMAARVQASHEQLEDQVHERTEALLALNQAALTMTAELEPDRVLQVITDLARELVGATYAALGVPDKDGRIVQIFTAGLTEAEQAALGDPPSGRGVVGYVLRQAEPLRLADLRQHPEAVGFPPHHPPMTSFLGVPIVSRGRVLGILYLTDKVSKVKTSEVSQTSEVPAAAEPFTPKDQRLIETLAAQAAVAIENSRLYETERRRRETASALLEIAEIVSSTLDFIPLLQRLALRTAQVCGVNRCSLFLLDEAGKHLEPIMSQFADERSDLALWQAFKTTTADHVDTIPVFRQAIRGLQPVVLEDATRTDLLPRKWTQPFGIQKLLIVPLVRRDQAIGLMALDYTDASREFTQEQIDLAMTIGSQVAASIENAQLYARAERRAVELESLHATGVDISSKLELPRLLQAVLERAVRLLGASGGELGLYDEASREISIVAGDNMGQDYTGTRMALGEGAMGYVAQTCEPLIIHDYNRWEGRSPQYAEGSWYAALAAPLMAGGRLVGAIGVVNAAPDRQFSSSDLHLLSLFAQQAAIAVEKAQLFEAERAQRHLAETLRDVASTLSSTLDLAEVLAQLLESLAQIIPYDSAAVFMVEGDARQVVAGRGFADPQAVLRLRIPLADDELFAEISRTHRPLVLDDARQDARFVEHGGTAYVRGWIGVPLISKGKVIGSLTVDSRTPGSFGEREAEIAFTFARQAAVAIENARLFGKVQRLSLTDGLTGLANRRAFDARLAGEIRRARRYNRPLALIMADIDHFKHYNDSHGHPQGDVVLRELAGVLVGAVRETDFVARYGGEEFAVILPETDRAGGLRVAEKVCAAVAAHAFPLCESQPGGRLTISLGVATLPQILPEPADLVQRADEALYRAKREGRGRVCEV